MNNPRPTNGEAETTGRYLVLFRENAVAAGIQMLSESIGIGAASADQSETNTVILNTLGVAVVSAQPEQLRSLSIASEQDSPILAIEPERVVYALSDVGGGLKVPVSGPTTGVSTEYLRGYRDSVVNLIDNLIPADQTQAIQAAVDESVATWGLQETKVVNSCFSGRGIKVAVLDTGLDLNHPDFVGRSITSKSFVSGEEVQDGQGHGTHCIETACGPLKPNRLPRYGIAYDAEIYAGKVLSNQGSGTDGQILQGIEWAIANSCGVCKLKCVKGQSQLESWIK